MAYSTGIVTNTRAFGTAATNIVVSTRNLDAEETLMVTLHIFASVDSNIWYTAYYSMFEVEANSHDVREFFIAGNVAYEVQVDAVTNAPQNVLFTVTGLDEFGNLVENERYAQSELSFITQLSPVMI
ncbi:hypothetical protein [Paenibacillus silvisoli]|uniref:hypothetical protein n=1 Tax=Paenibacillus silvisoli TaxID=3110539 RepID=UPI00280582D5|nr:hypothetical protein [Paenibacillus silvisoli]